MSSHYKSPDTGILSHLPTSWVPYAEFMRPHKPVGIMNIFSPYVFGALYAACTTEPFIDPKSLLRTIIMLFAAAFMLRSAGCTWNDIIDQDLDRQVTRCRLRPIARGAIRPRDGYLFTAAQCFIWLGILSQISTNCLYYAVPLTGMVAFYPFAKRVTDYAQVILGLTLAWGVFIGYLVVGADPVDLIVEHPATTGAGLVCLFMSYVLWTIIHDTIHAYQDIQDDLRVGIRSMTIRYRHHMTLLLPSLAAAQIGMLLLTGRLMNAGILYAIGAPVSNAALLIYMIWQVDLDNPDKCWWWFQYGCLAIGEFISVGLLGEYFTRL
ncbi:MAG: hypothetical protein Q9187_007092 [Circinaria calcarea]